MKMPGLLLVFIGIVCQNHSVLAGPSGPSGRHSIVPMQDGRPVADSPGGQHGSPSGRHGIAPMAEDSMVLSHRSIGSFTNEAVDAINDLVNKMPCDMPTNISKTDLPLIIKEPGSYCIADELIGSGPLSIKITANNVHLDLKGHTCDLSNTGLVGIEVNNCTNVLISNGIIQNSAASGSGIHITNGSQRVTLDSITFLNCSTGIKSDGASSITIKNCLCKNGSIGIQCSATTGTCYDYVIAKSSTIDNVLAGIQLSGTPGNILREVKIRDCHILNTTPNADTSNPTYGLQIANTRGLKVEATTLDTNTYAIAITGSSGLTFKNSKVLNSAAHGIETVYAPGPLMEALTFDNLMIDGCGNTGINCSSANNVTLKEVTITNAQQSALTVANSSGLHIDTCRLSNALGATAPIVFIGIGSGFVDGVRMHNCVIQNKLAGPGLTGLQISQATNVAVEHSTISTNSQSNGNNVMVTGSVGNCLMSHCMIVGNTANGINYTHATNTGTNLTIVNSHIFGAQSNGITINNANNCSIRNCEIGFCQTGISCTNAQAATIMNNIISNCLVAGITLDSQSQYCHIRDNAVSSNVNASTATAVGINNQSASSAIFHNYAYANNTNYQNVSLVTSPAPGTGAHENVQS